MEHRAAGNRLARQQGRLRRGKPGLPRLLRRTNDTGVRHMHMRLALTAVLLLSFVSTGVAQDSLQFVYPEAGTEVALNTYQDVRVRWLRGDRPVVNGTVGLRTDLGMIEVERAYTDSGGIAAFSIT